MNNIVRCGVLNDIHGPWHDPRAVDLVLDIFEDLHLHTLYLNGDIFDFCNISRHKKKDPRIQTILEDELYWGDQFFKEIRKRFILKGTKVIYIRGNHEEWLDLYLLNVAPAFWHLCQLEKMIDLSGVQIEPYNKAVQALGTNLFIQHSPPSYAATGPMTALKKKSDASFIWGCTHRLGHAAVTGGSGRVYHGLFNGWLGSTTLTDEHFRVFKYMKGHENWQQGAAVFTVDTKTKDFWINQFHIQNYRASVNGFLYEG